MINLIALNQISKHLSIKLLPNETIAGSTGDVLTFKNCSPYISFVTEVIECFRT